MAAARRSRRLHAGWVTPPQTPKAFREHLARAARPDFCIWHVEINDKSRGLVGVISLGQIFYGAFQNAYLGFYAFEPHAGHGLMREAVMLALRDAFKRLKLHRVEANLQPDNARSRALVKNLGFSYEGYSPRFLKIAGRWRDHERWALHAEDFSAKHVNRRARADTF